MTRLRAVAVLAVLALAGASCTNDTAPTGSTIAPEVATILTAAADAMGSVNTVVFTIERGGDPVFIDLGEGFGNLLEFKKAEGRFDAPAAAEAIVTVNAAGFNTQVGAVAVDGEIWLSIFTGAWQVAPPTFNFDPTSLFDPSQGFSQLFATGLTGVTLIGAEDRDGVSAYHVQGTADEARVEVITANLVTNQNVILDAWLDQTTGRIVDATFTTQVTDGMATWLMTFRDYDSEFTIEPPDLGDGG